MANLGKLLFEIALKDSTKQGANSVLQNNKKLVKDLQKQMEQASVNTAMLKKTRSEQQIIRMSEKIETMRKQNTGSNLTNLKYQDRIQKEEIRLSQKREKLLQQQMTIASGGKIPGVGINAMTQGGTSEATQTAATGAITKMAVAAAVAGLAVGVGKMLYGHIVQKAQDFTGAATEQLPYLQHLGGGPTSSVQYMGFKNELVKGGVTDKRTGKLLTDDDYKRLNAKMEMFGAQSVSTNDVEAVPDKWVTKYEKKNMDQAQGFFGGVDYGNNNAITGTQNAALASTYARARNTMSYGKFGEYAGRVVNTWGLTPEQIGNVGQITRFGSGGGAGDATKMLFSLLGGAVKSGNEANADKFIQKFQDAVYQGVMDGSQASNTDLLSLFTSMMGGSQRFKELAPGMLQGIQGLTSNTMGLQGGMNESMLMTSVMRATGNSNVWDARDFMAKNPIQAQKMMLGYMRKQIKDPRALAYAFSSAIGKGNLSSAMQTEYMNSIDQFQGGDQSAFMDQLETIGMVRTGGRESSLSNQNKNTSYQAFMQSMFSLSTASEACANMVNGLTNAIGKLVNGIGGEVLKTTKNFNIEQEAEARYKDLVQRGNSK